MTPRLNRYGLLSQKLASLCSCTHIMGSVRTRGDRVTTAMSFLSRWDFRSRRRRYVLPRSDLYIKIMALIDRWW